METETITKNEETITIEFMQLVKVELTKTEAFAVEAMKQEGYAIREVTEDKIKANNERGRVYFMRDEQTFNCVLFSEDKVRLDELNEVVALYKHFTQSLINQNS